MESIGCFSYMLLKRVNKACKGHHLGRFMEVVDTPLQSFRNDDLAKKFDQ